MSSLPETEIFLAVDVGTTNTRASLFDVIDGRYRLVATSEAGITAAEQAGCYGVVLLGDVPEPAGFSAIRMKRARDLADAPRVMVPDEGGCWHDHG